MEKKEKIFFFNQSISTNFDWKVLAWERILVTKISPSGLDDLTVEIYFEISDSCLLVYLAKIRYIVMFSRRKKFCQFEQKKTENCRTSFSMI
jgi:hypothetical protein